MFAETSFNNHCEYRDWVYVYTVYVNNYLSITTGETKTRFNKRGNSYRLIVRGNIILINNTDHYNNCTNIYYYVSRNILCFLRARIPIGMLYYLYYYNSRSYVITVFIV